ncbi:MAG: TIGR02281 family clan AA aspartic protease [Gammaproteobacteria bacterium]|nr:TIGR02281 family clan AA aspartic protease [Gammaproteobacteria bacterium]
MRILVILLILLIPIAVNAQPSIQVVGLFKNKALVVIDGKQKVMRVGQSYAGVVLESANSRQAILSYNGKSESFALGSSSSFRSSANNQASYSITPGYGGTYRSVGTINGKQVDFVVDTGASTVSLNSELATKLGIDFSSGKEVSVLTANDKVDGYMVTLDTVTLGSIRIKNVEATVLKGAHPEVALLGMSFLKHLKIVNENGRMKLLQQ